MSQIAYLHVYVLILRYLSVSNSNLLIYCSNKMFTLHRDRTSIVLSDDVGQIYLLNTGQGESQKDAHRGQDHERKPHRPQDIRGPCPARFSLSRFFFILHGVSTPLVSFQCTRSRPVASGGGGDRDAVSDRFESPFHLRAADRAAPCWGLLRLSGTMKEKVLFADLLQSSERPGTPYQLR